MTIIIEGGIREVNTGAALFNVLVKLNSSTGLKERTWTGRDGRFGVEVPDGVWNLRVEPQYHQSYTKEKITESVRLDIQLIRNIF